MKVDINVKPSNANSIPFRGDIIAPYLQSQISFMVNRIENLIMTEIYFSNFNYRLMIVHLKLTKVGLGI